VTELNFNQRSKSSVTKFDSYQIDGGVVLDNYDMSAGLFCRRTICLDDDDVLICICLVTCSALI